jgi:hypothetical protein
VRSAFACCSSHFSPAATVFAKHPALLDAAACGLSQEGQERVVIFVSPADSAVLQDEAKQASLVEQLAQWAAPQIAQYVAPRFSMFDLRELTLLQLQAPVPLRLLRCDPQEPDGQGE